MYVCHCMKMTKEDIIAEYKAKRSTRAGTGCGGCLNQVHEIIKGI